MKKFCNILFVLFSCYIWFFSPTYCMFFRSNPTINCKVSEWYNTMLIFMYSIRNVANYYILSIEESCKGDCLSPLLSNMFFSTFVWFFNADISNNLVFTLMTNLIDCSTHYVGFHFLNCFTIKSLAVSSLFRKTTVIAWTSSMAYKPSQWSPYIGTRTRLHTPFNGDDVRKNCDISHMENICWGTLERSRIPFLLKRIPYIIFNRLHRYIFIYSMYQY